MSSPVKAIEGAGGKALAIHLEKQDKERRTMPFYTTLTPAKPLVNCARTALSP